MKLYPKLALSGFAKNGRFYLPYLLTCAGMVMMCYIVRYLVDLPTLETVRGGAVVKSSLGMGTVIIGLFALIFLFYTNSFLMRRRKKEFGLYNILGLSKGNLSLLLLLETVLLFAAAMVLGLAGGISLSKLSELLLFRLVGDTGSYHFFVNLNALRSCLLLFGGIFCLLYLNGLRQLHRSSAIRLLRSENVGEKPPRANYLVALLGLVLLGGAYFVAVRIQSPIEALTWFFAAVGVVIVATYLLFLAGSVALCRLLQKNKGYYYQKHHFVSVSSMAYRMKRNGAGLASVCILCTMVLVMMVGSCCLYFGTESSLQSRYPYAMNIRVDLEEMSGLSLRASLREEIDACLTQEKLSPEQVHTNTIVSMAGVLEGETLRTDLEGINPLGTLELDLRDVYLCPLEDYNREFGRQETLEPGQALVYGLEPGQLSLGGVYPLELVRPMEGTITIAGSTAEYFPSIFLVVGEGELEAIVERLNALPEYAARFSLHPVWQCSFDPALDPAAEADLAQTLAQGLRGLPEAEQYSVQVDSREANRAEFMAMHGAVLFLGALLSVVFLFATVLILYYKQITEGYEDQSRFEIMQKVGMSREEIRKSVNAQLLTVFFLPLGMALVHLGFAFPMIRRLLLLFNLWDLPLLLGIGGVTVAVFALLYFLVYRITARAYYKLVAR